MSSYKEETNLPKDSVVNVSQVFTVDKSQLDEYVGTLSTKRVREMLNGINLVLDPREPE
ncbi:MAG: type II toxin-antitoxin system PemK/MazF family toxin [Chloroflexi bacterium]|nr:type II toxin-antitoxin system PemK/MazF family toxin [Chloroflexota bacterium]